MMLHAANELDGRRVYFTTSDSQLLARSDLGGRLATLLLPTSSCPP